MGFIPHTHSNSADNIHQGNEYTYKNRPEYTILLEDPAPFEMTLAWEDDEFSRRFYNVIHDWGIPTEDEVAFINSMAGKKPVVILDMACGGGRHSMELAQMGHKVTGIEIGAYPIEMAKKEAANRNLDVDFIQGDILTLNKTSEFDLAFLICGQIEHFSPKECQIIFNNISRALKSQGIFIVHQPVFSIEDKTGFTSWYTEKRPFYFENPSFVHREQFYFKNERVKLIRDFAVDTVTRKNNLFGISEKYYTQEELIKMAENCDLQPEGSFGSYDRSPIDMKSTDHIFLFTKK